MRKTMLLILLVTGCSHPQRHFIATKATWDGQQFSCPASTEIYADETEALTGKPDYVYCVYGGTK
jgi:hypothetical protein